MKIVERLERARYELDKIEEMVGDAPATLVTRKTALVGNTEIAEMVGVDRGLIGQWVARGKLPVPIAHLACGRIWLKSDIEKWIKERAA